MTCLDKHSSLDLVMVSVVSSNPSGGRQFLLKYFKPLDVNSDLKCKCDLIMKNSNMFSKLASYRGMKWGNFKDPLVTCDLVFTARVRSTTGWGYPS